MLGRARSEDKEEIATNLPPLRSRRRKNKTWKVHWVCVSKRKLMGQNLPWSTAEFRVRVFSPTSSGQNRWLPVTWTGFLGREGGISNVWKNAGKKLKHSYQKLKHSSMDECFNFWYECFNFLPAFFHTLEIPPSLPKNPVHVTGSQRFWPLDVGLNTLTRNSAVLQGKFCPINFLLLTHTQCTFQVLFFRLRLRSGGRFVAISSLSSDLARPSITM